MKIPPTSDHKKMREASLKLTGKMVKTFCELLGETCVVCVEHIYNCRIVKDLTPANNTDIRHFLVCCFEGQQSIVLTSPATMNNSYYQMQGGPKCVQVIGQL